MHRSLLRGQRGARPWIRTLSAEGCVGLLRARRPALQFALEVLSCPRLLACEQQQSHARPVCALHFCCSSSLPLLFFKNFAHGPSFPKPEPCYCTSSCRWTAS